MRGGLAKNAISNVLEWKQQAYRAVDMESARLTIIQKTQVVHATNNTGVLIVELDALETKRPAMASAYVMKTVNASVMLQH